MIDVLIVGAGLAGSSAAIRLARQGYEVLLVDRCRFPRLKPCGEYYNPEGCRLLAELGLLPKLEAAGAFPVEALQLAAADGCGLVVPFAGISSGGPALSLGREVLDTLLVEEARHSGATVWEEALVREPLREEGVVRGALIRMNGVDREVRARLTLAADGLRSRFARCLGLGVGDGGRKKIGLAARYPVADMVPPRVLMSAVGDGCCGLAVRGGEANLGMVADGSRAREIGGDPAAFFHRELKRFPQLAECVEGPPLSLCTVGSLTWRTRSQSTAGCLLLGDAAGFYDPFTGQGVTFALLTAQIAARIAGEALAENDLSARRLAHYSRERRRLLEPKLLVQRVIQEVIARPQLLDHVVARLNRRPDTARELVGVIADVLPATRALWPGFLARLVL
jgi:flavin-dependent dehydrogenase